MLLLLLLPLPLGGGAPETYRLQFAPLASPHAQEGHQGCTDALQTPPEPVSGNGVCVEGCCDEVNEVDGEGEVGDEFGARDEEKKEDDTVKRY